MFAIDRYQKGSRLPYGFHHQFAAGDQRFLVRQPDTFTVPDGFIGGLQAGDSDNGRNYRIYILIDRNRHFCSIPS